MNVALAVSGALGGLCALGAATWAIVKAIFRQIGATEDNTKALQTLTQTQEKQGQKLDGVIVVVNQHGERIARLEGRP